MDNKIFSLLFQLSITIIAKHVRENVWQKFKMILCKQTKKKSKKILQNINFNVLVLSFQIYKVYQFNSQNDLVKAKSAYLAAVIFKVLYL